MIKSIDKIACTSCGLCEKICPMDVFRTGEKGDIRIAYQKDCCTCLQCMFVCPADAVIAVPGKPKKFDMDGEWSVIKTIMGIQTPPGTRP